jgi:N utilization substance protein A
MEPVLEQERTVKVYVRPDQLSLAIGKAGQNVRLAARLTGWKIDIKTIEPDRLPTLQDLFEDIVTKEDD